MKIIVTGGAGFIGSHITDSYIKAGHKVAVVDDLSTGFRKNVNPRATFYKADIRDRAAMDRIFKKELPEAVNHHAAIAAIGQALRDPMPTFDANLLGTASILLSFGKYGTGKRRRFVFASSGAVYGTPKKIPVTEQTPTHPESAYGLSKLLDESIISFYAEQFGFSYVLFRYPNVYGVRQNPKGEAGVTAVFAGLMIAGESPTIRGRTDMRDYVYVEDIARANLLALSRGKDEIITLGRGKGTSVQEIFDAVAVEVGFSGKPQYLPHRKGDAYRVSLSAQHAKQVLGWSPNITLEEGVQRVVKSLTVNP